MYAIMEAPTGDAPKLPDMVMCGDHPSLTKTELNVKEPTKVDDKEKVKEKPMLSYAKISPTQSRTEGSQEARALAISEHALRVQHARRRMRSPERERERERERDRERADLVLATSRPIVQAFPWAAMGSFRWPPYLLAMWVLVLVLTHLLHCIVSLLERALPALKKCTDYFRSWTEDSWKVENDLNHKVCPVGLAAVTGALYVLYFALYAVYAAVAWAIEPLCPDDEPREPRTSLVDVEAKVTDYVDDVNSKTNSSIKQ